MAPIVTLTAPLPAAAASASSQSPATATPEVQIRQFRAKDLKQVEELFTAGMMSYATNFPDLRPLWEGYVNESISDDIAKIEDVYMRPGGNFWVATVQQANGGEEAGEKVIGMVALEAKPEGEGELRRMSVNAEYRRYGLGRKLVTYLENWAREHGFKKVWLSTGSVMTQACKFYPSIGYEHTKTEVFSEDPHFEVFYFAKNL